MIRGMLFETVRFPEYLGTGFRCAIKYDKDGEDKLLYFAVKEGCSNEKFSSMLCGLAEQIRIGDTREQLEPIQWLS